MNILIIDDDAELQKFLERSFKYRNDNAFKALTGQSGLTEVAADNFDIILLDLLLPDLDGGEVLSRIRESGNNIPVIVFTPIDDVATKTRLLNLGADDFVTKPFSFDELYARMKAILRRSQHKPVREHIKIGDLELVPEKRTARRAGQPLQLRSKEYDLLVYLMSHTDQVIYRDKLIENVWGTKTKAHSNIVDSHISSLRAKVDRGHAKKLIKTVHGAGYMMESV